MKNIRVILIILAVLVIVAAVFFVTNTSFFNTKKTDTWSLVPESATAVYESEDIVSTFNRLEEKNSWNSLKELPSFERIGSNMKLLDSLIGKEGRLHTLLASNPSLISLHVTSRHEFDFVFFVQLANRKNAGYVDQILENFKEGDYALKERIYETYTINEIYINTTGNVFSYLLYKNNFIGSFTPFLIEDVVRNISEGDIRRFKTNSKNLFSLTKVINDDGNLYVNIEKSASVLSVFANSDSYEFIQGLNDFAKNAFFDIKVGDNTVLLNGFTFSSEGTYLSTFLGQKPKKMMVNNLIPENAAIVHHFTFDDVQKWTNSHLKHIEKHEERKNKIDEIDSKYKTSLARFYTWFDGENTSAVLESVNVDELDRLSFIRVKDMPEALNQLNRLAEYVYTTLDDSLYREEYGEISITHLAIENFPEALLGPAFSGYEESFFAPIGNYIVIGNSIQVLKNLVTKIEEQETWGKSVKINHFLESGISESNVSLFINTSKAWSIIEKNVASEWMDLLKNHSEHLRSFEFIALQFSEIDNKFYTSLGIQHKRKQVAKKRVESRFNNIEYTKLYSPIISSPFVVRSHSHSGREVLLQDSLNTIYMIDRNGKIAWDKDLGSPLTSDVKQIDYYNNGKIQYFFTTENKIHIKDRNGNNVEGFPIAAPLGITIRTADIIDYNNSKNYRLVMSDQEGYQYLYNKEGHLLKGWNPKKIDGKQSRPLRHVRVRGKDCMIIQKDDGTIHLTNRRGVKFPGFPLELNSKVNNPLFITIGSGLSTTFCTTVSEEGEVIKFNLKGSIVGRDQLYKPSKEARFTLVVDELGKNFVIARQESNRMSILNAKGETLFEKDYLSSEMMKVQYYNFNTDVQVFAITDQVQEFTYMYNKQGELYNGRPLESGFPIRLMYLESTGNFRVFSNYGDKFRIISFSEN